MRTLIFGLLALAGLFGQPGTSRAAFGLSLVGVPATFTPGTDFSFDIVISGPVTYDSYQVTVLMTSPSAPPGSFQFLLDGDPMANGSTTPSPGYFAAPGVNFFASTNAVPNDHELAVTDSALVANGFNTAVDTSRLLYTATVRTTAGFSGPLNFRFSTDPTQLLLLNDSDLPANVDGYDPLVAALNASPGYTTVADGGAVAVPVPPTLVVGLVAAAGLLGAGRRRVRAA